MDATVWIALIMGGGVMPPCPPSTRWSTIAVVCSGSRRLAEQPDTKQAEGSADQAAGKLRIAVGGLKNAIRKVWGSLPEKPGRRLTKQPAQACKGARGETSERPSDAVAGLGNGTSLWWVSSERHRPCLGPSYSSS